jgi:hypothetical protein
MSCHSLRGVVMGLAAALLLTGCVVAEPVVVRTPPPPPPPQVEVVPGAPGPAYVWVGGALGMAPRRLRLVAGVLGGSGHAGLCVDPWALGGPARRLCVGRGTLASTLATARDRGLTVRPAVWQDRRS